MLVYRNSTTITALVHPSVPFASLPKQASDHKRNETPSNSTSVRRHEHEAALSTITDSCDLSSLPLVYLIQRLEYSRCSKRES